MTSVQTAASTGGIFALLTILHFVADWVPQSHSMAMAKSKSVLVRARHCLEYTVWFTAVMAGAGLRPAETAAMSFVLFFSHFVEDTYLPVMFWAKYVRMPPSMRWRIWRDGKDGTYKLSHPNLLDMGDDAVISGLHARLLPLKDLNEGRTTRARAITEVDRIGFLEFLGPPIGMILLIAIDQIVHIVFLLPVAYVVATRS